MAEVSEVGTSEKIAEQSKTNISENNFRDWVFSIWEKGESNPAPKQKTRSKINISEIKDGENNIRDWVVSIREKKTIGRVPRILRKVTSNEACFDPEVVSLGPYHGKPNQKQHLKRLENYKPMALLSYTQSDEDIKKAKPFYEALIGVVDEVKKCYEEKIEISDQDFAWMMLIDGCFFLVFINDLLLPQEVLSLSEHDKSLVLTDLMLLENQLPFLVLKTLTVTKENEETAGKEKLLDIINQFTNGLIRTPYYPGPSSGKNCEKIEGENNEPAHLLDSFRTKLLGKKSSQQLRKIEEGNSKGDEDDNDEQKRPFLQKPLGKKSRQNEDLLDSPKEDKQSDESWFSFRCASELKAAGIKFRRSNTTKLSDVRFKSRYFWGELFLPPIVVDDSTKHKFLNMIAYELCPDGHHDYGISNYIWLMDSLIDTVEDVKVLRSADIVLNMLGSDKELAKLFNVLAKDLVPDSQAYAKAKTGIKSHCERSWKVNMAILYYTHFSTPWASTATVAAIILLLLTLIQTFLSIQEAID